MAPVDEKTSSSRDMTSSFGTGGGRMVDLTSAPAPLDGVAPFVAPVSRESNTAANKPINHSFSTQN